MLSTFARENKIGAPVMETKVATFVFAYREGSTITRRFIKARSPIEAANEAMQHSKAEGVQYHFVTILP